MGDCFETAGSEGKDEFSVAVSYVISILHGPLMGVTGRQGGISQFDGFVEAYLGFI